MTDANRLDEQPDDSFALPSLTPHPAWPDAGGVSLPGSGSPPSDRLDDNSQLPRKGEPPQRPTPARPDEPPAGASRADRLRSWLETGGLRALPESYRTREGDWQTIMSENVFERLLLDWQLAHLISPELVERHYRFLADFWKDVTLRMQSAEARIVAKKFTIGDFPSPELVMSYPDRLQKAFSQLQTRAMIDEAASRYDAQRRARGTKSLQDFIDPRLGDGLLTAEKSAVFLSYGVAAGLTEREVDGLLLAEIEKRAMKPLTGGTAVVGKPRSGDWATDAAQSGLDERARRSLRFEHGSASTLRELVVLSDRYPVEATEYLTDGVIETWIGKVLLEGALYRRIKPIHAERRNEPPRALEMVLREICVAEKIADGLPKMESVPAVLDFGVIPVGTEHRRHVQLRNAGRGIAWGTIGAEVAVPGLRGPRVFGDVRGGGDPIDLTYDLDTIGVAPGKYERTLIVQPVGIPETLSIPVRYEVRPLDVTIAPRKLNFGSIAFGSSRQKSATLRWKPADAKLEGEVTMKSATPGIHAALRPDGGDLAIDVSIDGSVFAAGKQHDNVVLIHTNSGDFSIPISFRVALHWATVAKWSATFAVAFAVMMTGVRILISGSSPYLSLWASDGMNWDATFWQGMFIGAGLLALFKGAKRLIATMHRQLNAKDAQTLSAFQNPEMRAGVTTPSASAAHDEPRRLFND